MKYEGNLRVSWLDWLSLTLVVVGGLNWGLVGIGNYIDENWNLVDLLLGWAPVLENLVYVLVGLAALYELYFAYQLRAAESRERPTTVD